MALKNLWSVPVDEAIVANTIKDVLGKDFEVFFPYNSQLTDVDLAVINLKNHKLKTILVQASQSFVQKGEHYSLIRISKDKIFNQENTVDFFIIVVHFPSFFRYERKMVQSYIVVSSTCLLYTSPSPRDS